jgi:superfamily II DNA or RNA helicase
MELRQYQKDIIDDVRLIFSSGEKRVLAVLPCGAGKTLCFADMCAKHVEKHQDNYVWFLVHRRELIDQTMQTFEQFGFSTNQVLVAMVQSVSRNIDEYKKPTLIIFDEAHHAVAKTWTNILKAYPNVPVVGLTATPVRLNGQPLGNVFDKMVVGVNTNYLIANKFLAPFNYYAPKINLEDAQFKIKGGEFDLQDVEAQFDKVAIYGNVINHIDLTNKIIIYCPSVAFSKKLENEINSHFLKRVAKHFDGNTDELERRLIVNEFRDGKLRVLLNVDLVGEGFDVPDCNNVFLLRPTMSVGLYIQQSMRALRYQENKTATIYDFVGNVYRHGLPNDNFNWNLVKPIKVRNTTNDKEVLIRECKNCFRVYGGTNPVCPYCQNNNGKTKTQLQVEQQAELEKVEQVEKKKERMEVGMAKSFEELLVIGKKRGYKNPAFWARTILKSRNSKHAKI